MRKATILICVLTCLACAGTDGTSGGAGGASAAGGGSGSGTGGSGIGGGNGGQPTGGTSGSGTGGSGTGGTATGGSGGGSAAAPGSEKLLDAIEVTSFALDSAFVYFTAVDTDAFPQPGWGVYRVAKTGGAAQALAKHVVKTYAVSVDATSAYYVTHDTADEKAALYRVDLGGGTAELLDEINYIPIEGPGRESVATDDWVYWAGTSSLQRFSKKNKASESMGGSGRHALAVDSSHAYSLDSGGFEPTGSVLRTPLGTDKYVPVAQKLPRPMDMAIDNANVYLVMLGETTQQTDGSLVTIPKSGGTATPLVSNVSGMLAIAVDDTHAYFGAGDATIQKVAKTGGAPVLVAAAGTLARGLALDATHAYWHGQMSIHRAPR